MQEVMPKSIRQEDQRPQDRHLEDSPSLAPATGPQSRVDRLRAILQVIDDSEATVGVDHLAADCGFRRTVRRDLAHLARG